ncbi:MAG: ABC transporter permease [Gammaproteobacteria bacterium]
MEVIAALMAREMRTRFAGGSVGYLWAYIVPMAWIGGLVASFAYLGRSPTLPVDVPSFVASGMLPYVIFRQTITAMSRTPAANRGLALFPGVRLNDVLAATALLELFTGLVLFAVIMGAVAAWTGTRPSGDLGYVASGVCLAWAVGASFGRLAAILITASDFAQRIIPLALRPMFWLSGIFFTARELPPAILDWLTFNPLLHATEFLRQGYFRAYLSPIADARIPLAYVAAFYFSSHALQLWLRDRRGREFPA